MSAHEHAHVDIKAIASHTQLSKSAFCQRTFLGAQDIRAAYTVHSSCTVSGTAGRHESAESGHNMPDDCGRGDRSAK